MQAIMWLTVYPVTVLNTPLKRHQFAHTILNLGADVVVLLK